MERKHILHRNRPRASNILSQRRVESLRFMIFGNRSISHRFSMDFPWRPEADKKCGGVWGGREPPPRRSECAGGRQIAPTFPLIDARFVGTPISILSAAPAASTKNHGKSMGNPWVPMASWGPHGVPWGPMGSHGIHGKSKNVGNHGF